MADDNINEQVEVMNLESLITGGIDTVIPITITYMGQPFTANVRPINSIEHNKVVNKYLNNKESIVFNTVKLCLLKDDGTSYKLNELEKIPAGITEKIYEKIQEISGIENNLSEEESKLVRELMGF